MRANRTSTTRCNGARPARPRRPTIRSVAELLEVHCRLRSRPRNRQSRGRSRTASDTASYTGERICARRQLARGAGRAWLGRCRSPSRRSSQCFLSRSASISATSSAIDPVMQRVELRAVVADARHVARQPAIRLLRQARLRLIRSGRSSTSSSLTPTRAFSDDISRSSVAHAAPDPPRASSNRRDNMRTNIVQTTRLPLTSACIAAAIATPPPACAPPGGGRCGPRSRRGSGGSGPAPARPRHRPARRWCGPRPAWSRRSSRSISRFSASPRSMRCSTRHIQPQPSRHGVHWPQLSCL